MPPVDWTLVGSLPALSGTVEGLAATPLPAGLRYERLGTLGQGAMGVVAVGWDRWLGRNVALKIPVGQPGSPSEAILQREARLAARLDHPAIAAIYDVAEDEQGRPFFVMRLVRGEPLHGAVQSLGRAAAVRAVRLAAEAVAHAHQQGIVHRDLSPGNVLVGAHGAAAIVDWGVAAEIGDAQAPSGVGTPGYAAPEQLEGAPPDPRADVWSLGALLRLAAGPRPGPELRAILKRASAARPADRYDDAAALARDLVALEVGDLVGAYRYPLYDRLVRRLWPWRHLVLVGVVALLALAAQGWLDAFTVRQQRDRAVEADRRAVAALAGALAEQALSAWRAGDAIQASELAERSLSHRPDPAALGILLATATVPPTPLAWREIPPCERVGLAPGGRVAWCRQPRSFVAHTWEGGTWTVDGPLGVTGVRADGGALVLLLEDGSLQWRDAASGEILRADPELGVFLHDTALWRADRGGVGLLGDDVPPSPCDRPPTALDRDASGTWWIACEGGAVFRILPTGPAERTRAPGSDPVDRLVATEHGVWATTRQGALVRLDGASREVFLGEPARALLPVAGRPVMVVRGSVGRDRVVDLTTGARVLDLPRSDAIGVSPSGELVTVRGTTWTRWALPAELPLREWRTTHGLSAAAFAPDGRQLVVGDGSGHVWALDLAGRSPARDLGWQQRVVKAVAFAPDGSLAVATVGEDPIRTWDASGLPAPLEPVGLVRRLFARADGSIWGARYGEGVLRVHPDPGPMRLEGIEVFDVAYDPRSDRALLATDRGVVEISADGEPIPIEAGPVHHVAVWGPRYAVTEGRSVRIRGDTSVDLEEPGRITAVAFVAPTVLATGSEEGVLRLYDDEGVVLVSLPAHDSRISGIVLSPDGTRLATISWDGRARLIALDRLRAFIPAMATR